MEGKTPPNKIEVEQTILGAILIDAKAVPVAIECLKSNEAIFYDIRHQAIYKAVYDLYNESQGVDLMTVAQKLKHNNQLKNIGSEKYLIELTQKISSGAHVEYHCRLILQDYIKRTSIKVGGILINKGYDETADCFELLDESYKELDNITEYLQAKTEKLFKDNVNELIESFNQPNISVPSAIDEFTRKRSGFLPSNLFVLAARPGMGKTAYILSEAKFQAENGYPVGICSMEMSERELTGRIASNHCSIDAGKVANRKLKQEELATLRAKVDEILNIPIYINDQPGLTLMEVKVQAKKWYRERGIKILYIDYLQLMRGEKGVNREQQISEISRGLKELAKELDIPVVALSQLSRQVEQRGGIKKPQLSDLRESGAIEQDADVVCFIYRPEYYGLDAFDDQNGASAKDKAELVFAKYRNGYTGKIYVSCFLEYMRFTSLVEDDVIQAPTLPDGTEQTDGLNW